LCDTQGEKIRPGEKEKKKGPSDNQMTKTKPETLVQKGTRAWNGKTTSEKKIVIERRRILEGPRKK